MTRSRDSWPNSAPPIDRARAVLLLRRTVEAARLDPNDFAEFAFTAAGRPLRQAPVHRDLQHFLSAHGRALVELPRDHGKSFQVCLRVLWELGHAPGLRVKLVGASEALAVERGRFLRDAVEHNARVRLVFPHLSPGRPWGADRFTVARPADILGPSVTALGVGAASTGARADLLVCDDIVDVRSIRSAAERERVKLMFFENLLNLLEPDGRAWNVFTPWHADDLNAELKRRDFALFRRPVGDDLEPVWPEKWPRAALARRRAEIGPVSFARAYRLVAVPEGGTVVRAEWVRYWSEPAAAERVVMAVDPALSTKRTADASALVTLARTAGNEIRCLEALGRRVDTPALMELIDDADRRWGPDVILFESNGAFQGIRDLMTKHARFGPRVKGVTQVRDKESRVRAFSVLVENGTFRLHGSPAGPDPSQQALFDEMVTFPFGEHDDLLDAAAFGANELLSGRPPRVWSL